jgi:hypothetical protein
MGNWVLAQVSPNIPFRRGGNTFSDTSTSGNNCCNKVHQPPQIKHYEKLTSEHTNDGFALWTTPFKHHKVRF